MISVTKNLWTSGFRAINRSSPALLQTRSFFRILNSIANRPDKNRIKEIGPDRACAEWLLRNGATIRWKGFERFQTDYNNLPLTKETDKFHIEEVDADEASIMYIGFDHFDGCRHIRTIRFHHLPYLDDDALGQLRKLKDSLECLSITSCGDVTDSGLASLTQLSLLKYLQLVDLPEVKDMKGCYNNLQQALPECRIEYKDIETERGTKLSDTKQGTKDNETKI